MHDVYQLELVHVREQLCCITLSLSSRLPYEKQLSIEGLHGKRTPALQRQQRLVRGRLTSACDKSFISFMAPPITKKGDQEYRIMERTKVFD